MAERKSVWLCLRCGFRSKYEGFDPVSGDTSPRLVAHNKRCDFFLVLRYADKSGRIVGSPGARAPQQMPIRNALVIPITNTSSDAILGLATPR